MKKSGRNWVLGPFFKMAAKCQSDFKTFYLNQPRRHVIPLFQCILGWRIHFSTYFSDWTSPLSTNPRWPPPIWDVIMNFHLNHIDVNVIPIFICILNEDLTFYLVLVIKCLLNAIFMYSSNSVV